MYVDDVTVCRVARLIEHGHHATAYALLVEVNRAADLGRLSGWATAMAATLTRNLLDLAAQAAGWTG